MAQQKCKVNVPEGWIAIPEEAASGEKVIIQYVGDKKVSKLEIIKLVSINKATTTIYIGGTEQLTATTIPANQAVTWTSSDDNIATVDANGKVTGVALGTATITATSEDGKGSCEVTVIPAGYLGITDAAGKTVYWKRNNLEGTYTWADAKTAATNDGGELPTKDDFVALANACYWVWGQKDGTDGMYAYKLRDGQSSNYTGNTFNNDRNYSTDEDQYIFLPVSPGYSYGIYWSGTGYEYNTDYAYCLYFRSDDVIPGGPNYKTSTCSVRTVRRGN